MRLGSYAGAGAIILAVALGGRSVSAGVPEVPAVAPQPFAVLPLENRSGIKKLDWMSAAVAFMVGEKAEENRGLRAVYGPLVLPEQRAPAPANAETVLGFARKTGARWVWTGWFKRPNWKLQLAIELWRVRGGEAKKMGEVVSNGDFKQVHEFAARAIIDLSAKAGVPVAKGDRAAVLKAPTGDFYAFTLLGRGLAAFAGTGTAKDLKQAKKNLQRAIFIDPKLVEGQRVLAELYRRAGLAAKARGRIDYALKLRPSYYPAIVAAARLEMARGKRQAARTRYAEALALRPWDLDARFRLGEVLWELGQKDDAFRELTRVVNHRPDDVRAHRILVKIHAARGEGAELVSELEAVVRLEPDDERARLDLGAAYVSVGRQDRAIATYQTVVDRNPKQVQALKFLGDLYRRKKKFGHAIKYYGMALRAKPDDPRPYFLLGASYVEVGNDKQAKRVYRMAQRFKRYLPEVHNNLGAIAYREGKLAESIGYLKRAVAQRPNQVRYRYNFALSLSASQRTHEALVHIRTGLALQPEHAELHYLHGVVLLRTGDASKARGEFERTLHLSPEHDGALHNIALLEEMKRRAQKGEVQID